MRQQEDWWVSCGLARGTARLGAPGWEGENEAFLNILLGSHCFSALLGFIEGLSWIVGRKEP